MWVRVTYVNCLCVVSSERVPDFSLRITTMKNAPINMIATATNPPRSSAEPAKRITMLPTTLVMDAGYINRVIPNTV